MFTLRQKSTGKILKVQVFRVGQCEFSDDEHLYKLTTNKNGIPWFVDSVWIAGQAQLKMSNCLGYKFPRNLEFDSDDLEIVEVEITFKEN